MLWGAQTGTLLQHSSLFLFCFWSTDEIRKDLWIQARVSVSQCVCVSVTRDLRNRSMDHSEILGDVRGQKSKNRHTAAFLNF